MNQRFAEIWVYLAASPLLGLTMTLLAYQVAVLINRRCQGHPLANPVLISISALVAVLWLTGTPYHTYFDGAQFVHFLLGPATVALAIPLHAEFRRLTRMAGPLIVALVAGSLTAALSALLAGKLFGASYVTLMSLAPKSATTPIAMGVAERIGGLPSLTSVLVILTGVLGSIGAAGIYRVIRCTDPAAKGFALGLASHGIGTARAFQMGEREGTFAALAMGLNGMLTAILLPWLIPVIAKWLH